MTISRIVDDEDKIKEDAPARPILNQTLRADARKKLEQADLEGNLKNFQ